MAHPQQREYFKRIKTKHPELFRDVTVLDIGSLDINGNNRYLFDNYRYIGIDIGEGKNVDIVCKGHEYNTELTAEVLYLHKFDVVISSECFEHDMYYDKTLLNAVRLLKSGGLFIFSCASTGRKEHGTLRTRKDSSPLTTLVDEWANYYKNLTEEDVRAVLDVDKLFSEYAFEYDPSPCDLYFYGIKK